MPKYTFSPQAGQDAVCAGLEHIVRIFLSLRHPANMFRPDNFEHMQVCIGQPHRAGMESARTKRGRSQISRPSGQRGGTRCAHACQSFEDAATKGASSATTLLTRGRKARPSRQSMKAYSWQSPSRQTPIKPAVLVSGCHSQGLSQWRLPCPNAGDHFGLHSLTPLLHPAKERYLHRMRAQAPACTALQAEKVQLAQQCPVPYKARYSCSYKDDKSVPLYCTCTLYKQKGSATPGSACGTIMVQATGYRCCNRKATHSEKPALVVADVCSSFIGACPAHTALRYGLHATLT